MKYHLPPLLAVALIALSIGCSPSTPRTVVIQAPEVSATPKVDAYADKQDRAQDKAAASVTVAREAIAAAKPTTADKELEVAQANLPRPTTTALAEARKRAEGGKAESYAAALKYADELQAEILDAWGQVEQEKARNDALELQLKANQRLADATREQDRLDAMATKCNWLGGALILAGIASFAVRLSFGIPIDPKASAVAGIIGACMFALPSVLAEALRWQYFQVVWWGTLAVMVLGGLAAYGSAHRCHRASTAQIIGA